MLKIIEKINVEELADSYYKLEKDIIWGEDFSSKGKQAGLQYRDEDDKWSSAIGKSKGNELFYDKLNPYFKGTMFENLINKYSLKRTRLMWLNINSCYSFHRDETPRIHIPIISNDQCFFIFKLGLIKYLEPGNVYWVNTKLEHTAMNGSLGQNRLHLVGVVEK